MAERLQRQRKEYEEKIDELEAKLAEVEKLLTYESRHSATLEAKLTILATILDEHRPQ